MASDDYKKALKMGKAAYRRALSRENTRIFPPGCHSDAGGDENGGIPGTCQYSA